MLEGLRFYPHLTVFPVPDGVTKTFTCPLPFVHEDSAAEVVYRNGVRVNPESYSLGSSRPDSQLDTITFRDAPLTGDTLLLAAYVEINR